MMFTRRFAQHSIRRKLVALCTTTASMTVLLACTILWVYQLVDYRNTLRTEESSMAQLIAESSVAALLFKDSSSATETLATLRSDPRVETACLYDKADNVVASFSSIQTNSAGPSCPRDPHLADEFTQSHLLIFRPIKEKADTIGTLYLSVSLAEMNRLLLRFAKTGLCVLLITSIFALTLSSFLQRPISLPIIALTQVATQVSDQGNYLLRAQHFSDDETGVLIHQFNAMMDHIQQRETDLQQAHASLEEKVRIRTQDLSSEIVERKLIEADLEMAKSAAEESNRAKSAFLANMSHELRTPLNAIIGYSEMLYEDAQAAKATTMVEDLGNVLFSARHLLTLISDILDLSKIEAGQMKMRIEPASASSLLQDVLPTAEILARRNNNVLEVRRAACDRLVEVDILRFRQVLLNLLSNACKFTENGRISVAVEEKQIAGKDWILWSIRDTGMGISADDLGKLFQTFSQVDSSETRRHGGSGLGLAISQQLCQAMNGHITIESEPGAGSIFTIHLPAATIGPGTPADEILELYHS